MEPGLAKPRIARPYDARAVRSREALREALLRLIGEKSFDEISIRDITAAAGVSYPVFFRQFEKKEDLLEDIATEEVRHLLESTLPLFDPDAQRASSANLCRYVQEHRALWKTLLTQGASSAMREEFIRVAKQIAETRERKNPQLPLDLAPTLVVSGIFEILAWWLRQPEDYPIENVTTILEALVVKPILEPLSLKPVALGRSIGLPSNER